MYCPRKKFLPACWHLSSVLLESEVSVRPAQVGALFLHNLRVCLTFLHVMYAQITLHYSDTTWGCPDSFGMLCTFKIMLHYSDTTWGCADFFACFRQYVGKGSVPGEGHSLVYTPSGSLGPQKGPVFKQRRGVQVKLWQWAWLGGAHGLSGWVCYFLPSIYTHMLFFHV
jgi:hypothetical protein